MARPPLKDLLRQSLAGFALATSVFVAGAQPVRAEQAAVSPWGLYFQGKAFSARDALAGQLRGAEPPARSQTLEALLDICIASFDRDCVLTYTPQYIAAAKATPVANEIQRREQVRRLGYYVDYGRWVFGSPQITAKILDGPLWDQENSLNEALYLKRLALAANIQLEQDDPKAATHTVDRMLSLIASLKTPQEDPQLIAWALSNAIGTLVDTGDTERAFGVYAASRSFIARSLPILSVDAAVYRLREASLLLDRGDLARAAEVAEAATVTLRAIELNDEARQRMVGEALLVRAMACAGRSQWDCAHAAMADHPLAARFAKESLAPRSLQETTYLAARALIAGLSGVSDPVAAAALSAPPAFTPTAKEADRVGVYRAIGAAMAGPPGSARQDGLFAAGRQIVAAIAHQPDGALGVWYRPGFTDQVMIALALTQADRNDPSTDDLVFALLQLAARQGASVDADALTALGQATDGVQRRSIHQALRLRARRDQLERAQLQKISAIAEAPSTGAAMSYDFDTRRTFRDFAGRIGAAGEALNTAGVAMSGAHMIPLKPFQAVLKSNEAALTVTQVPGGLAYMCVRRDRTVRRVMAADLQKMSLDIRLLQSALSAGHAPSEALDAQFPVAAAMRLYDLLIRPFEGCFKAGDHILWLPNASITPLPLSILLEHAPPKLEQGWDLEQADWLVRRHAVSYAGSAAMVAANRSGGARPVADFDFLGVGDPLLSGVTATGEDRGEIVSRGVRGVSLSTLAALPETRMELEASAKGFGGSRLLTGAAATESGVRGQLIGSYRYLSFATHGLLRDEIEGLADPALALTPVSASDTANDGLLTASEIADLNLAARFVALSACNTANFDLSQMAADLPALASAFAVAGTPSVLGTLWPVDSQTGQRVVAGVFARLRDGLDPGTALALAQRAFLANPPGRAYLHPRFWAPFIVLGDGAEAAGEPATAVLAGVTSVELLTKGGDGEVIALERSDNRTHARFIGGSNAGKHSSGVQASRADGAADWRWESAEIGASGLLVSIDGHVIAGGYAKGAEGRFAPTLEALDRTSGRRVRDWTGAPAAGRDSILVGGAGLDRQTFAFAVVDHAWRDRTQPAGLRVFTSGADLAPTMLFEIERSGGRDLDDVTITLVGEELLVTYSGRYSEAPDADRLIEDDFETPLCRSVPITWIEVRDLRTGVLKRARELKGWTVTTALKRQGEVLLGGAVRMQCEDEMRAGVLALNAADEDLTTRLVMRDESLGTSEARSLSPLPRGAVLVAGRKENRVDFKPQTPGLGGDWAGQGLSYSGLLIELDRRGAVTATRMLDSGSDVFVMAAETSTPQDIQIGGAVGRRAAIIHMSARGGN